MTKRRKKRKNAVINMRARRSDLDLIDQAARALGKTRSEFIRNAAEVRAMRVMEMVGAESVNYSEGDLPTRPDYPR